LEVPNILKPFRSLEHYFLRYVHPSNFSPHSLSFLLKKHGFNPVIVDDAGNDWREPQNLSVVAQETKLVPQAAYSASQTALQVQSILRRYQRAWRWKLALLWYSRSSFLSVRRMVFRLARYLKMVLSHFHHVPQQPVPTSQM
jgi:hypothetical protein